jgi:predicted metal-dependent phosphoesterase TrpH
MTVVDLQVYSFFSLNSYLSPKDIIKKGSILNLDFICIADYNIYEENTEFEYLNTLSYKTKIIRGVELKTDIGNVLVFGLKNNFWNKIKDINTNILNINKLIAEVEKINGVLIYKNPFSKKVTNFHKIYESNKIKIMQTLNGKNNIEENTKAQNYAKKNKLKEIGGSEANKLKEIGKYLTLFKNKIKTEEEFIENLKQEIYKPISLEDYKTRNLKSFFTF